MKTFILSLILLVFLPCFAISSLNFPNVIWVYWETNFQQAPLITRVSYEKLIVAAKEVNWTVTLVTGNNIHQYISNIEEFNEVVKKGKRQTVQEKSDLLRIWLVQENGGVWIDFACIPLENFDWLRNYSSIQHLIINRMGTNLDDPDMLMLGEGWHQSPLSYYNSDGALVADEYFGMAIHFVAAKKKAPIMTDWKNKMKTISAMSYKQMLPEWKKHRLYFHNIDRSDVYYSGNIALESTLQLKQFQIDQNLTLFSKHLSVYEHYKIWCIHGEVGPIGFTRGHALRTSDFFMFTRTQVEERAGRQRFYLKIPAYLRSGIEGQYDRTRQYLVQHNKTVEQIVRDGPTPEQCHKLFIVEGSILHSFYKDSKYFEQLKVPIISIKQRDILRKKCLLQNPDVYKPIYQMHSVGSLVSAEREMYAEDTSIRTQLWVWWVTHNLSIHQWMEKYRGPVLLVALYGVLKLLFGSFLKKFLNRNNDSIDLQSSQLSDQTDSASKHSKKIRAKSSLVKLNVILTLAFVGIMYMTFYQLFDCIQYHGKFPFYNYIAFMAVVMVGINEFVKRQTKHYNLDKTGASWSISLQTINVVSRMFLLIYAGHCVLMHFHIMWFYAYRDVLIMVGMGYLLYVMFFEMQRRKLATNKFHEWIVYLMGSILPWGIVGFFCLVTVWRNPMYLTSGDHYVRLGFITNLSGFFNIFSKLSIGYFFIISANNIVISFRPQQSHKGLSARLLRQESIIFILSSIYWLVTYTIIANKYSNMEENLDSFDHIFHMKYFMLQFAVFEFAIRLKTPQQLDVKYKIALYIVSFIYTILFCIFGFDLFRYLFTDEFNIKIHFCVLTLLLALLALIWEIFANQQRKQSMHKINYQELHEHSQVPLSDVKIRN